MNFFAKTFVFALSLFFSWKAFGWFEVKKFEPDEKNPLKIEANRELFRKFKRILPPDAKIVDCPQLVSGHRPTRDRALSFTFMLPEVLTTDQEEVKSMFLSYLEKIVEVLNTTPQIRPYVQRFPFDADEVEVSMMLSYKGNISRWGGTPRIYVASFYKGNIRIGRWIRREGSSVANEELLIVPQKEIADILLPPSRLNKEIKREISLHPCMDEEGLLTDALIERFRFSTGWAKKEGYIYLFPQWYTRDGFTTYEERIKYSLGETFCAQEQRITLEEAKKLIRKASQAHLAYYQKEETACRQVTDIQKEHNLPVDGKPRQENLSLRFLFWDKYIDYVEPPYIAEIYTFGRKAYSFTADDRQRLVLVAEEELPNEWEEPSEKVEKTA